MPVYFITGRLGSGKSLIGVRRAQEYLEKGLPVATNMDLHLEHLVPHDNKNARLIRVPDQPTAHDIDALGSAYEGDYDEKKFGLMLFDELGSWLNSRGWNSKERQPFIETCIHLRKRYWDVAFLVQDIGMVDAQVRNALCEYLVTCKRTDRLKIPGTNINAPKMHVATVYYGDTPSKQLKEDTWIYRGKELYKAYDTTQSFSPFYDKGTYCPLPPGYYIEPPHKAEGKSMGFKSIVTLTILGAVIAGVVYAGSVLSGGGMGIFKNASTVNAAMVVDDGVEDKPIVNAVVLEDPNVLDGYQFKGHLRSGEALTLIFENTEGDNVQMDEELFSAMGYQMLSVDHDRLVAMIGGESVVFSSR